VIYLQVGQENKKKKKKKSEKRKAKSGVFLQLSRIPREKGKKINVKKVFRVG
tara:strand:- start:726 stop:881 length:156 start_codon:yes stop_codon:yes gene_type:complete